MSEPDLTHVPGPVTEPPGPPTRDDLVQVCRGCYVELMELRRMVIEELPEEDRSLTGFVSWRNALKSFAQSIAPGHVK